MRLQNKHLVMLVEEGFEDLELWYPVIRLREEGAKVTLVGSGSSKSYNGKYGLKAEAEAVVDQINPEEIDGLLVPGGWAPDKLRRYPEILEFVRKIHQQNKLIATICHAGWVLVSAKVLPGYKITCCVAIIDDMENAGATYLDEEVVVDRNMVSSRTPKDLPAYMRAIIEVLEKQK